MIFEPWSSTGSAGRGLGFICAAATHLSARPSLHTAQPQSFSLPSCLSLLL